MLSVVLNDIRMGVILLSGSLTLVTLECYAAEYRSVECHSDNNVLVLSSFILLGTILLIVMLLLFRVIKHFILLSVILLIVILLIVMVQRAFSASAFCHYNCPCLVVVKTSNG
jgi:hypothetical protein